ncbi:non-specific lipid transfer protein GPI-anchored 1 [Phtheirospermum japonicum]|uniref:Non-specific lipid transfer protein GPI-anchored 1 n=1 Tax=Phtheirospermum japonicum TaxID=374723 RepID=A0A830CBB8_9LAMI|nr:non-specific lipid transfer protein GPI-anchored 1 [Phtheirospermum japonicum]
MLLCLAVIVIAAGGADESLAAKCSAQFQKVTQCLPFATAKAAAPSKDCCDSVTDLKASDPACLCFIIQQIHNGSNAAVKSMGVQETRLLQLPSVCKLANASVSECPSKCSSYSPFLVMY